MLILLRTLPDERLQEVITSIPPSEEPSLLVYLEGSLDSSSPAPLILANNTYALSPTPPAGISSLTQEDLLQLIHDHSRILVLP